MKVTTKFLLAAGIALALAACNQKACKRIYECVEDRYNENYDESDFLDDCEDGLDRHSDKCQRHYRDYARCIDFNDCDRDECSDEREDFIDNCGVLFVEFV